jgi:polyhydroxyalkanoate synthesis regulator phasin
MPTTTKKDKDLLARLADAGEDAIVQFTKTAAGKALAEAANQTRNRVDELSRRVRGVETLEARVTSLEKQVASLKKASRKPARKPATPKPAEPKS